MCLSEQLRKIRKTYEKRVAKLENIALCKQSQLEAMEKAIEMQQAQLMETKNNKGKSKNSIGWKPENKIDECFNADDDCNMQQLLEKILENQKQCNEINNEDLEKFINCIISKAHIVLQDKIIIPSDNNEEVEKIYRSNNPEREAAYYCECKGTCKCDPCDKCSKPVEICCKCKKKHPPPGISNEKGCECKLPCECDPCEACNRPSKLKDHKCKNATTTLQQQNSKNIPQTDRSLENFCECKNICDCDPCEACSTSDKKGIGNTCKKLSKVTHSQSYPSPCLPKPSITEILASIFDCTNDNQYGDRATEEKFCECKICECEPCDKCGKPQIVPRKSKDERKCSSKNTNNNTKKEKKCECKVCECDPCDNCGQTKKSPCDKINNNTYDNKPTSKTMKCQCKVCECEPCDSCGNPEMKICGKKEPKVFEDRFSPSNLGNDRNQDKKGKEDPCEYLLRRKENSSPPPNNSNANPNHNSCGCDPYPASPRNSVDQPTSKNLCEEKEKQRPRTAPESQSRRDFGKNSTQTKSETRCGCDSEYDNGYRFDTSASSPYPKENKIDLCDCGDDCKCEPCSDETKIKK